MALVDYENIVKLLSPEPSEAATGGWVWQYNMRSLADHVKALRADLTELSDAAPSLASGATAGLMSASDFSKLSAATSTNTPSTLVSRDLNGDVSVGTLTAQSLNVASFSISGDILPTTVNQNIGAPNNKFQAVYAKELYLDSNTLYIGDTPVLGTDANTVIIKADPNQSVTVQTSGTGQSTVTSVAGTRLETTGLNGDVVMQASGAGGRVVMGATTSVNITAPTTSVTGNASVSGAITAGSLTVTGNATVLGDSFIVNAATVQVEDNILLINNGEVGTGVTAGTAGLRVDRGEALDGDYYFVFDESDDMFKVGKSGQLEVLASQNYVQSQVAGKASLSGASFTGNVSISGTLDSVTSASHHVVTGANTPNNGEYYLSLGWDGNIPKIYGVRQGVSGIPVSFGTELMVGTTTHDGSSMLQVEGSASVSGTVTAAAFVGDGSGLTGIVSGTTDHAALSNLDYANSGHTGFAGTGVSNTFTQDQSFSGSVGIGTSSPVTLLEVKSGSTTNSGLTLSTSSTQKLKITINSGTPTIESTASDLIIRTQTVTVFESNGGLSAIGNGSPSTPRGLFVRALAAGFKGLVVRGFAGQTANLQEWQDSNGNTLSSVTASGAVGIGTGTNGASSALDIGNAGTQTFSGTTTGTPTKRTIGQIVSSFSDPVDSTYKGKLELNVWDSGGVARPFLTATSGTNWTTVGLGNSATGTGYSVAIGTGATATGSQSCSFGYFASATGNFSMAIGVNSLSSGNRTVAIGGLTNASGADAIAIGHGIDASNRMVNSVADSLGVGFSSTVPTLWVGPGNGTAGSIGNVGIGVSGASATARLTLASGTNAAEGIAFGSDVNLYRSAADTLKTDDALTAAKFIANNLDEAIAFTFSGGGDVLTSSGEKSLKTIPFNCDVVGWDVSADPAGSVAFLVEKSTAGGSWESIVTSGGPSITSAAYASGTGVWASSITALDRVRVSIFGTPSTATWCSVSLIVRRK